MVAQEIKKVAIVLSGGLSRGAAHLAIANEIVKKIGRERVCVLSGASIGSINAYAIAVGHEDNLLDVYRHLDCDNVKHFTKKMRNGFYNDTFNLLEDDIKIPTYVTCTRMFGFDCSYFCLNHMPRKDLKSCINASMGFPIVNGPVRFANRLWIDGGATDNVPVWPTTFFDPDMVIILHCYSQYYPPAYLFEHLRRDCIVIDVDVSLNLPEYISTFSFSKTDFEIMLSQGQKDGQEFADRIFSDFFTENVRQRCFQYINEKMEIRRNKTWNGHIELVEMLNSLYQIKEGML